MSGRVLQPAIFLISAVGIAYEVLFTRIFAIAQWYHFAYMVITMAMLGFAAAGTVLTLVRGRLAGHEMFWLRLVAFLFSASLVGCYALSQWVPFETFQLVSGGGEFWNLLALYLILALPFFWTSTAITLGFFLAPKRLGRIYSVNMVGSGVGTAGVVVLLYFFPPEVIPYLLTIPAGLAFLLLSLAGSGFWFKGVLPLLGLALVLVTGERIPIRVSQYKGLSYALQLPDARIVTQNQSPLSVVTAVRSSYLRETPGQIGNYSIDQWGPLPQQVGLFFDAGAVSVINRFSGDLTRFAYLDHVTGALPYHLLQQPRVLVVGAGGGTDVLMALIHGADHVTAVEVDPSVFPMLRTYFRDFSGALYERPEVTPVVAEGRGFLQAHNQSYDLIQIALLDAFNASAAGVHALNESYLYTVEALSLYISRLSERGIVAVTRWLKTPPRDALKMFATMVEACEKNRIRHPARHLVLIRSWNTATMLVSRSPLSPEQVQAVRDFCRTHGFDVCYYPGIRAAEVNRYTILEEPVYYRFAKTILSGQREAFYRQALFFLRPATDDRPYFFRFFKWASLPRLIRGMGRDWVPFVEWGYLALVATLLQSVVISVVLVLLPAVLLARHTQKQGRGWVVIYFAGLGLAYLFLEMAFIQKFMLFLAYPVYAVAVVLTGFLVFSGWGSYYADRYRAKPRRLVGWAVLAIGLVAGVYLLLLPVVFSRWAGWPDPAKILVSLVLLAPLGFGMGIPFPVGLQMVADRHRSWLAWAWGINGCASVLGASLATLTAVHWGFTVLVLLAVGIYGGAGVSLVRLGRVVARA